MYQLGLSLSIALQYCPKLNIEPELFGGPFERKAVTTVCQKRIKEQEYHITNLGIELFVTHY